MTNVLRRTAAIIAAIACGLMLALVGTAGADERHGDDKNCAFGEAEGDAAAGVGTVPIFAPTFNLCRTGPAESDVTGYFAATVVPSGGLVAPQGPVTCAAFDGDTVSFLYPLNEKSNPPALAGNGILIVAKDGGATGDEIGFFGPAPLIAFQGNQCGFSTLPSTVGRNFAKLPVVTGDVTVRS